FLQKHLSHKGYPFYRTEPFLDRFLSKGALLNSQNGKSPLPGGQAHVGELGTTRHCCAPRRLIARSFEMRWTVPVPMPREFATFKIPTPLASCFRAFRSVALSIFGRPSFTP